MGDELPWQAVITQAIDDACRIRPHMRCTDREIAEGLVGSLNRTMTLKRCAGFAGLDADRARACARSRIEAVRGKIAT